MTPVAVSASKSLLGEENKVLVCTTNGFEWVATSSLEQFDMSEQFERQQHCSMCLLQDDNCYAVDAPFSNAITNNQSALKRPKHSDRTSSTLYLHEQGSRAPPVKN